MKDRFETFTILISKVSRYIRKIKSEEMAEYNLKCPHVSCLYYLYKNNGQLTAKELCDICDEDKAAISRSIDYLENNGYIECSSKTEKRYKAPISLTKQGIVIGKRICEKVDNYVDLASSGLAEKDRKTFYDCLTLICNNLQSACEKIDK